MDCLRSFNFTISNQANYNAANGFLYWQIGVQHFWSLEIQNSIGSIYNIQGFKNINIFKIELTGDVNNSPQLANFGCIVQNWKVDIEVTGQNSSSTGTIDVSPNPFNMIQQDNNPDFRLSKFQPAVSLPSPIQSAKQIKVLNFYCDGIANQSIVSAQIGYNITFTVFYKYEGE